MNKIETEGFIADHRATRMMIAWAWVLFVLAMSAVAAVPLGIVHLTMPLPSATWPAGEHRVHSPTLGSSERVRGTNPSGSGDEHDRDLDDQDQVAARLSLGVLPSYP